MENNKLELLDTSLLQAKEFQLVQHWLTVFKAEIGWHYYLDLIWQVREIKKLNLPPHATIIDAGAGSGMMQFLLASLGYTVLSIDFNERPIPPRYARIFKIQSKSNRVFTNEYIKHLNTVHAKQKKKNLPGRILNILKVLNPSYVFEYIKTKFVPYGSITFITADFSNLDFIPDHSIDAIVSTSAIEHNESMETLSLSIDEFKRVLKKGASMFITTSAAEEKTWWHEPSKGYCYSESELKRLFDFPTVSSNYTSYKQIFSHIKGSRFLQDKLPSFYFNNPNCGMPDGVWDPTYIPVGIIKQV